VAGFIPALWVGMMRAVQHLGGYKTRPYEYDTRAPMHPLAQGEIVIRFFRLLAIGGKTWFLLVFLALEFLSR
jgi:hypothetical protein